MAITGFPAAGHGDRSITHVNAVSRLTTPPPKAVSRGNLDSVLGQLSEKAQRDGRGAAEAFARSRALDSSKGNVRVVIEAVRGRQVAVRTAARQAGALVTGSHANLLRAEVPISSLEALSGAKGVRRIRRPGVPMPDVMSEGISETAADVWHAASVDGTGTKVGIIDVGFTGYPAKLGSELPSVVTTWGGSVAGDEDGGNVHGTAVAEVVNDMVPGANLYLARIDDDVDFGNAKDWMKAQGVDAINHSVGWFMPQPPAATETGTINQIASDAVASGIFWANSAGNYRQRHWMGDYTDTDSPSNGWMNWDGSGWELNTFGAMQNQLIIGELRWDDSWTNASQDYDFYLFWWDDVGGAWQLVSGSANPQDGAAGRAPYEEIAEYAPETGLYGWAIWKTAATETAVDFDMVSLRHNLDDAANPNGHFFDHERSLGWAPADNTSDGFMAVAAIGRAPGYTQEYYSSQGPARLGTLAPEIAGPANVTNSVYGLFAGTSASSPHVAGAAALLKQLDPAQTPADIEAFLESRAIDDTTMPGPDYLYGHGRLFLQVPTTTTAQASRSLVGYSGAVEITGTLNALGTPLTGRSDVELWSKPVPGGSWKKVAAAAYDGAIGGYKATTRCTYNTYFQLRFRGDVMYAPSDSFMVRVDARAYLTRPWIYPRVARRNRRFYVYGLLKPRHYGYTLLQFYRYYRGKWRPVARRWARNYQYWSTSIYVRPMAFRYPGAYLVRAYHYDASHARTWSRARWFRVR